MRCCKILQKILLSSTLPQYLYYDSTRQKVLLCFKVIQYPYVVVGNLALPKILPNSTSTVTFIIHSVLHPLLLWYSNNSNNNKGTLKETDYYPIPPQHMFQPTVLGPRTSATTSYKSHSRTSSGTLAFPLLLRTVSDGRKQ